MEKQNIILYEGNSLEKLTSSSIFLRKDKPLIKNSKIYLASDVITGQYDVTGFVIVDNKPEDRWLSYTEGDKIGVSWSLDDSLSFADWKEKDPNRLSHYVNTSQGFKMIRYFILPQKVKEFFERDKFLGNPMINKCACDGTISEEFDEEIARPQYCFGQEEKEVINRILEEINPKLAKQRECFEHHNYISFHSWQQYAPIIESGQESIIKAINNFDQFLEKFDQRKVLKH